MSFIIAIICKVFQPTSAPTQKIVDYGCCWDGTINKNDDSDDIDEGFSIVTIVSQTSIVITDIPEDGNNITTRRKECPPNGDLPSNNRLATSCL